MTLKEAKYILKKEGFHMFLENKVIYQDGAIREFEKPEVCEAIKVANENRLTVGLTPTEWDEREARLKKKHEENTKDPDSAENHIKEDSSENPALAESASQFNDALLDEQGKKIKRLGKEIARLNKIINKKNLKIEELGKESSRHLRGKMKMFGENFDLEQELKDKNAVLSDVAEELRLSKIREKNLTEVSQKYVKEIEDLREQLANKVVDKIDSQALKSAESALAWKEKKIAEKDEVIAELREKLKSINMNRHNERICKKQLAEKDEVIADLGKELAEAKKQNTAVMVDMTAKCFRAARESINDVFESYAAKYAKSTLDELKEKAYNYFNAKAHNLGLVGSKDGNGIFDQMVGDDIADKGADHSGVIVLCGKDCIDDIIKKMK